MGFSRLIAGVLLAGMAITWSGGCRRGTAVEPAHASRIVSQLPALTELCVAMGLSERLVGVTDFCPLPPGREPPARIGGILNPDLERVLALSPDLVLLQESQAELLGRYQDLGLPTLAVSAGRVDDIFEAARRIGEATGEEEAAARLVAGIRSELYMVSARVKDRPVPSALLVVGHEPGSLRGLWAAGASSFHDDLLNVAGGRNCLPAGDVPFPKVSPEAILDLAPETIIILDTSSEDPDLLLEREKILWAELGPLPAVQRGRICLLQGGWTQLPGPQVGLLAQGMADCLHPKEAP